MAKYRVERSRPAAQASIGGEPQSGHRSAGLKIGAARSFGGLTVFPLLGDDAPGARHRTLDEALADGSARVTEVSASGSVPDLQFVNDGDRPVLLLDGEELIGAKQNRVLNLTILAPAGKSITIPVSCVEQGRWSSESARFSSADHVMMSKMRMKKLAQVSSSLTSMKRALSNQSEVWSDVEALSDRYGVHSPTGKMSDVYEARRRDVNDYVKAFAVVDRQVGVVFTHGGKVRGLELFDHRAALERLLPKLVRSWALDVLDASDRAEEVPPAEAVRAFTDEVARCRSSLHDAVGLGTDVRFEGERLAGGAIVHDDRVVHLCAFRVDEEDGENRGAGTRAVRTHELPVTELLELAGRPRNRRTWRTWRRGTPGARARPRASAARSSCTTAPSPPTRPSRGARQQRVPEGVRSHRALLRAGGPTVQHSRYRRVITMSSRQILRRQQSLPSGRAESVSNRRLVPSFSLIVRIVAWNHRSHPGRSSGSSPRSSCHRCHGQARCFTKYSPGAPPCSSSTSSPMHWLDQTIDSATWPTRSPEGSRCFR